MKNRVYGREAAVDLGLAPWDIAASTVLLEEAGGRVMVQAAAKPDRFDALLGTPEIVTELAPILGF